LPVLLVEGYRQDGETEGDVADRLIGRIEQGYRRLKLEAAHYGEPQPIQRILSRVGRGATYVCDLAWSWRTAREGLAAAQCWADLRLDWIEDPMPRGRRQELAFLRQHSPVPIGIGDETTRAADLEDLMTEGAVDVVRIDATTVGGFSVAIPLAAAAVSRGYLVSFHVNPEVHRHAAFSAELADHIEMFPTDRPFDASHALLQRAAFDDVNAGRLAPPTTIGSGISLNPSALQRFAHRTLRRQLE
jgi:L-alanine-DL-glutamate epimerase-like enolase superfamily enzyme